MTMNLSYLRAEEAALAPASARSFTELITSGKLRKVMRQLAREEAERIYASRVQSSLTKATEEVLSDAFQAGFESLNRELKNTYYIFIDTMLTEMAYNGSLDDLLGRSIEC